MNILISVDNLNVGGPTKFLLRLSKTLSKRNNVYIYDFFPYFSETYKNYHKKIGFLSVKNKKTDWINWKINSIEMRKEKCFIAQFTI